MAEAIISARMPKQDAELIKKVAKARGEDLSDFVRRAVYRELASLSFLSDEQKKALGIAKPAIQKEGVCT
jgi:uncharacterized protein (DUF1778 family)